MCECARIDIKFVKLHTLFNLNCILELFILVLLVLFLRLRVRKGLTSPYCNFYFYEYTFTVLDFSLHFPRTFRRCYYYYNSIELNHNTLLYRLVQYQPFPLRWKIFNQWKNVFETLYKIRLLYNSPHSWILVYHRLRWVTSSSQTTWTHHRDANISATCMVLLNTNWIFNKK